MLVNGRTLCIAGSSVINGGTFGPFYFFEYDYVNQTANTNGTFLPTRCPGNSVIGAPFNPSASSSDFYFLNLPDGTVLATFGSAQLYVYQSDGTPLAAGKPTITHLGVKGNGSYSLAGTGFNGISEGAAFGDDAQMDSNYPLIRLTDNGGQVYYARTHDWSSTSVMTGSRPVSTVFDLPQSLTHISQTDGQFSLVAIANGNASDPIPFFGPVWADFAFGGPFYFGTYPFPYNTLAAATNAVLVGGRIFLKPGISHEKMTISKPMSIAAFGGPVIIGR
jgi:hypothetical protein